MKAIVCFSGGHSSALVAIEAARKYGKDNVILLNHDVSSKVEHADIKRFKQDIAAYLGLPITYANAENFEVMTPLEVSRQRKAFGIKAGITFCTSHLKTRPFYNYLEKNFNRSSDTCILYGFDEDETERIYRRTTAIRAMGYKAEFPLADWPRTIESTEEIGIKRPVTYHIFKHANCTGCLKAGKQHWYCVYCTRPDIWEEAKQAEEALGFSIIKGVYLKELEAKFKKMRDEQNICPNDKENSASFWKKVKEVLPEQGSLFNMPCDCNF